MTVEMFFANFGHLADAPNGVQKLKGLILQLAVQGKLVPQDSSDEPASVLLEKIETERKVLVKAGSVRKPKVYEEVKLEEQFCSIPTNWCWARMGELILDITGGGTPSKNNPSFWVGDIPWASVKDVGKSKYLDTTIDRISAKGLENSSSNLIPKGRVIVCTRMGLGKISINRIDVAINQDLKALWLPQNLEIDYFYDFFLTQDVKGTGMTVAGIRQDALLEMPVPLPPLEEQKRIVAKVDQLMALCNKLETHQQKQQQGRLRLNNATLDALLTAREPDEFTDHWQRICNNFDLLFDHPETIAKLRAAILQLAVQGKLVPQDPSDEPASVLLERVKVEKKRLVKKINARKAKASSPIKESECPFLLPAGWSWVRLEYFGLFLGGGTPSKQNPAFWSGEIPWVSPKDMKVQYITDSIDHVTEEAINNSSAKLIPQGALLMVVRGMILLHSFPVARTMREVTVNQDMKALICALPDVTEYLLRFLIAGKGRVLEQVERSSHGTCRLESDNLSEFIVALPPLEEQKRIITKVDQLMTLCGELEAKLNQAQQNSEKLMEATVRQVLVA